MCVTLANLERTFNALVEESGFHRKPGTPRTHFFHGAVPELAANGPLLVVTATADLAIVGPLLFSGGSCCAACWRAWISRARIDWTSPTGGSLRRAVGGLDSWASLARSAAIVSATETRLHKIVPLTSCEPCHALRCDLEDHCGELTGIVEPVRLSSGPSAGVYHASARFHYAAHRRQHTATGRGVDAAQARQGAVAEALERYSIAWQGTEPMLRAPATEIDGVIEAAALPAHPIDFLPAVNLLDGSMAAAPAAACLLGYPFEEGEPEFVIADSNGCGAGSTIEHAMAGALCELIERDAFAQWWSQRAPRTAVSFDNEPLRAIRDAFRAEAARDLQLLDLGIHYGVSVFAAVAAHADGPLVMSGAHPSPAVAAWKAASEVAQIWHWKVEQRLAPEAWLRPSSYEVRKADDPREAAPHAIIDAMAAAGLTPYCVDLSRPEVHLSVVRVLAPGLRHLKRYAERRENQGLENQG